MPNTKEIPIDSSILRDLYINQEKTQRNIAEIYNVSRMPVRRWLKKYGIQARKSGPQTVPISEQLKVKVEIDDNGCWNWTGAINGNGYGHLWSYGKVYPAHRISYEFFVGEIPEGLTIDHKCRNRRCVNPDHLEPVTMKEKF